MAGLDSFGGGGSSPSDSPSSSLSLESLFPRGPFVLVSPRRSFILSFTSEVIAEPRSIELGIFGFPVFVLLAFLVGAIVVVVVIVFVVVIVVDDDVVVA